MEYQLITELLEKLKKELFLNKNINKEFSEALTESISALKKLKRFY